MFIVLSAVEIPIIDLVLHRWPIIRFTLLAAGVWGLMWMLGLLLGFVTRPHSVGPEGVIIHDGPQISVELSWDDIYSVALVKEVAESPPKPPRITESERGNVVNLRVQNETNLEIVLKHPISLSIAPDTHVSLVKFWADEPRSVLSATRPFLEGTAAETSTSR
ncbi:hypothetical protein ACFWHR_08240 [Leucobacter sp. NPDC058333]|uniref:hypothetical protein n=1 Tax=Leucobacter sp. NPDC058333 TaxID=3346450 RepID=UPI003663F043